MDKSIENYGPYQLGGNRILVIRDVKFLKPIDIWPQSAEVAADNLVSYSIYEGVSFSCDLIPCHSILTGDTINGLKQWRLEKDGNEVTSLEEVKKISENLAKKSSEQWVELTGLPETKLIEKAVWVRCFVYKTLCDAAGIDWKPTKELLEAPEGKTLAQGYATWKPPENEKEAKKYWRRIDDPRIDFYP
ncbi:hypothetical protein HZC09_00240 [Candidatus Micrarchaeota archaeon]|nr:hypothetical protein [Candidatus Micrarchaeota archaeon]